MESNDDDLQMVDAAPERNHASPSREELRPVPRPMTNSTYTMTTGQSIITNGTQDLQGTATPGSENEGHSMALPAMKRDGSRQTSVLANDVAAQLNVEPPMSDSTSMYEEDNEEEELEEHEKPAPYKSFLPTGYCYDVRMRYHCELDPPKERRELHPEDPRRIFKIYQELCVAGLIENQMLNKGHLIPNPLLNIPVRQVTEAEVELVHDKKMWDFMMATQRMGPDELIERERAHDSIYFNTTTFGCALLSAGGAIETCRAVMLGRAKNAIAIIRPPGHHAEVNRPMGFCIFDNVSIAAKVCMADFGEECRRVLVLDWDVHHGNGIQQAFYSDPNVLYISLHVHEDGNFYPNGPYGNHLHCGADGAQGKNINIPWPTKGMKDADYMFAFQHIVMPVARDFNPDLVIIAAGFDAADGDQLGGCHVTPPCYGHMTHELMSLAKGKLVVCLEGGYNLRSISKSALAVTKTLVGEIPDRLQEGQLPTRAGIETVQMVAMHQSKWWPSIYPKNISQDILNTAGAERLHDAIRYYQASKMTELHGMINLNIRHKELYKSFENEVMVTPEFDQEKPLLIFLHDPPEMMQIPDQMTRKLEVHNMWMADGLKHYVDWAVENGLEVMDVNVPKYVTGKEEEDGYAPDDPKNRIASIHHLAEYLWDNYIDVNESTEIFFIGVGTAYQGIVHLLNSRTNAFTNSVTGIINFVDGTLVPANDQVIYDKPKWYRQKSLNIVSNNHLVWSIEKKKPSKRFGNLERSPATGLNDMLMMHKEEVQNYIAHRLPSRSE